MIGRYTTRPLSPGARGTAAQRLTCGEAADLGVRFKQFVRANGFAHPFADSLTSRDASRRDDVVRGVQHGDGVAQGALRVPALPLAQAVLRARHGLRLS